MSLSEMNTKHHFCRNGQQIINISSMTWKLEII